MRGILLNFIVKILSLLLRRCFCQVLVRWNTEFIFTDRELRSVNSKTIISNSLVRYQDFSKKRQLPKRVTVFLTERVIRKFNVASTPYIILLYYQMLRDLSSSLVCTSFMGCFTSPALLMSGAASLTVIGAFFSASFASFS